MINLVLASQSPRRKELLAILGYEFSVVPSSIDETPAPGEEPAVYAARVARDKGMDIASRVSHSIILSADTVVTLTSGNKLIVRDSMESIREKIIEFKRRIYGPEAAPE